MLKCVNYLYSRILLNEATETRRNPVFSGTVIDPLSSNTTNSTANAKLTSGPCTSQADSSVAVV